MNEIKKNRITKILIAVVIGICSVFVFAKNVSFQPLLLRSIQALQEQEEVYKAIVRASKGVSDCLIDIEMLDGGVFNNLDTMGALYIVILGAIYVVQTIMTYAEKIVFWFLVPVACLHYLAAVHTNKINHKKKIIQCILLISVILIVLPFSVKVTEKVEKMPFYSVVRETTDYLVSYDEDADSVQLPSTNEEARILAVNNSKTVGLLVVSKIVLPLVLVGLFMKIMRRILLNIPFIKKQLIIENAFEEDDVKASKTEISEKTPEEIQIELEIKQKEKEEKAVQLRKYRRNKWIVRVVFFVIIFGVFFGLKSGMIKMPSQVKSILIGTSTNLKYKEFYLNQDEELQLLTYEDCSVATKGIKKDECGGHALTLLSTSNDFDVYVTDVLVNGITVEPYSGPSKVEGSVRLFDDILIKYMGISSISDISFTLGIRKKDDSISEGFVSSNNVKLIISEDKADVVDTTNLGKPVYLGEEVTMWLLGKGKGSTSDIEAQYYLIDNRSEYDMQMYVASVLKDDVEILGEHEYGSSNGDIRSGKYGLARFESFSEELEGKLKTKIKFQAEVNSEQLNLFGKEYREIWRYRKTFGDIDNTDYIDIEWIYTP